MKKKISAIVLALVILFGISFSTPVSEVINPDGQIKVIAAATNSKIPHLTGVANTTKGVKVSWNKLKGATKYKVYRRVANGSWSCIATVTSNTYTDTKAVSGTTYRCDIERIAVAAGSNRHTRHIAVGRSMNRFTRHPLCLKVETAMKVIGAQFGKIAAEKHRKIERQ